MLLGIRLGYKFSLLVSLLHITACWKFKQGPSHRFRVWLFVLKHHQNNVDPHHFQLQGSWRSKLPPNKTIPKQHISYQTLRFVEIVEISWALRRSPRHWSLHKRASPCHSCWWADFQVDLLYLPQWRWGNQCLSGWCTTKQCGQIEYECFTTEVLCLVSIGHGVLGVCGYS